MKRPRPRPRSAAPARSALVQIEKPIYGGAFLARIEGKATFVPLTLPGEEVRVLITEEKRSYAAAEPEEIITQAANRVVPACRHFGACGGCQYQHAGYEAQLAFKQAILRETLERGGVRAPEEIGVLAGNPWHYRNRIRLAVDASGRVGYRARQSHAIIPIAECPIAAPLLVRAALSASEILRGSGSAFRATEIALFCNADESELLASIFTGYGAANGFDRFAQAWKEQIPELAGAELVQEDREGQARTLANWGGSSLTYRAAGLDYRVDHGAFFQVNRWLLDEFVDRVVAERGGTLAWDLYAGVGLFARRLAERFERVVAVEAAPTATDALRSNLHGTTGSAMATDTHAFLRTEDSSSKPDLIVVDPPRTGLGAETTARLADVAVTQLVYVSCDPATLARDLKTLIASGYSMQSITLADLFPQTFHLETVVELVRS